ncbi:hypothetical protein [Microbacterium gorillae]|uniref:hypothetical protein n=1 Tax=Microbacterium gorillae TaxID=1231063 RepID=UPI003D98B3DF
MMARSDVRRESWQFVPTLCICLGVGFSVSLVWSATFVQFDLVPFAEMMNRTVPQVWNESWMSIFLGVLVGSAIPSLSVASLLVGKNRQRVRYLLGVTAASNFVPAIVPAYLAAGLGGGGNGAAWFGLLAWFGAVGMFLSLYPWRPKTGTAHGETRVDRAV